MTLGTARIALLALLLFALAWGQPGQAGTQAVPEIQDPANDVEVFGEAPGCVTTVCAAGGRIDATTVWIDTETATSLNVNIITTTAPGGATAATSRYEFHATFGGSEVVAVVTAVGGQTVIPPAPTSNVASVSVSGNTLTMTILKSVYGAPVAGQPLTNLFYLGVSSLPPPAPATGPAVATDRAPNTGAGTDYIFVGGGGGNSTLPGDSDSDGLNDTCEQEFFGGLNSTHNGTGDADGDGLTNGQECASNPRTDPTKADTDGDGTGDKDDPFPTDPTKGGTSSSTNSTTGAGSTSSSTSSSRSGTGSNSTSSTGGGNGEVRNLGDAVEKLQSDIGYLGISAGGLFAVLLLAVLALAVRWSL